MSDESDDNEIGNDSLTELKNLIDELSEEISSGDRKKIFKMAEFLIALNISVEICQIQTKQDNYEYSIVIPISQINNLRKALLGKAL
jgi:hypothetical protein